MSTTLIQKTRIAIESLGIYRGLLNDEVISKLHILFKYLAKNPHDIVGTLKIYNEFYYTLMKKGKGSSLRDYIIKEIIFHENHY